MRRSFLASLVVLLAEAPSRAATIPIGYCSTLQEIDAARAAGFDYVELRTSEIAALPDVEFEKLAEELKRKGPPVPVTFLFIPPDLKLTGPAVDEEAQRTYVRKALTRVARLGARTVVLGSGTARRVPEGFPMEKGLDQFVGFCRRLAPEAASRGITIAIEPQRPQESNIVNSVAEALDVVRAVDDPAIQLVVDFYHLAEVKEDPSIVVKAAPHVRHLHMANPTGRVFPLRFEEYDYAGFFRSLRQIGYEGRMSVEARSADFAAEAPRTIAFLRGAFER
jgi:sugar phosphate isomerase/epimerase